MSDKLDEIAEWAIDNCEGGTQLRLSEADRETFILNIRAALDEARQEDRAEIERLRQWERASQEGHPSPCTMGPLCPYCEIERLRSGVISWTAMAGEQRARAEAAEAKLAEAQQRVAELRKLSETQERVRERWEAKLRATEAELAAAREEARAEQEGTLALRVELGARDDETFSNFVRRLAIQSSTWREDLKAAREQVRVLRLQIGDWPLRAAETAARIDSAITDDDADMIVPSATSEEPK